MSEDADTPTGTLFCVARPHPVGFAISASFSRPAIPGQSGAGSVAWYSASGQPRTDPQKTRHHVAFAVDAHDATSYMLRIGRGRPGRGQERRK